MSDSDDEVNNVYNEEVENGHVSPTNYTDYTSRSNDSESESDDNNPNNLADGEFDTDLPSTHKYLGKLNNVSGYTLYDEGEIVTMLGIHTKTLVFPGFILPLMMNNIQENTVMKNFLEKQNVFVLLCGNEDHTKIYHYGVTMEIYETQIKNSMLSLKARGRQRCLLLVESEFRNLGGRLRMVSVKILPELMVVSPICDTQFLTLKTKRGVTYSSYEELMRNYKYRRHHLAQYPLSNWIYDRYEFCYLVKIILDGLLNYYNKEYLPIDPIKLSYWFVQNFQLQHTERLRILSTDSVLERLRLEYIFLNKPRMLACSSCRIEISEQCHVFAMSKDGVQSNYCNPGGHVFETVTVSVAKNFVLIGTPSKQFSWFPGYAWTMMQCKECGTHLGWMFTSKNLKPNIFYGLAKGGFCVQILFQASGE